MSACTWGSEIGRRVDEDHRGQQSRRWKSVERKSVEREQVLGVKAGRNDEFHFGYVELSIFV